MITQAQRDKYQTVIGLEIHAQLQTESKIFAHEGFVFGSPPNHFVSPVSVAHPGALPFINQKCIELAIRMGLATHCKINQETWFARKNYFYPDLPKGYQLSQDKQPICVDGYLEIKLPDEPWRKIDIERIHLEEDAGKSIHDQDPSESFIDLNRAGVGLIEIVTRPDLRSAEEAGAFFAEVRRIVRYLDICSGNMEEGSLRCDANVSVMLKGSETLGTRAEIKNMNSINQLIRAVKYEADRQIEVIESGGKIIQETRTWDVNKQITASMRHKETADDYRYFPEPDLQPLLISQEYLENIEAELPKLPGDLFKEYHEEMGIPFNEAMTLVEQKSFSDYYEELRKITKYPKAGANWVLGPVRGFLNENNLEIEQFPLSPKQIAELIQLVKEGKVSFIAAKEQVFPNMVTSPEKTALKVAT
ncbi:MAG: Asp-tRNA(Asn)/Glu-tRNA(Gln) amidotransferase subunit GatB, partial [Bacteroidetes bacterium]|nr:Asp-tRNA(Asn)/Glu-tRNA(Gln) amidotransferase subunit GatB [Bacteroidota bacterium]